MLLVASSCTNRNCDSCNYVTDYFPLVNKADIAFRLGNYEEAYEYYHKAFSFCKAKNTTNYYELIKFADASVILKQYEDVFEALTAMVLQGRELKGFKSKAIYDEFFRSKYGQRLEVRYDSLRSQYLENVNVGLQLQLNRMLSNDQLHRGRNVNKQYSALDSIDTLNEQFLINIFENYGYPTEEMVGPISVGNKTDLTLILLHTLDSIRMNYFVPKLKQFIQEGTASPYTLGSIIDQYYIYNGEAQIYGTYKSENGLYQNMIDDIVEVDRNRASIGLPTLRIQEMKDSLWLENVLNHK